MLEKNLERMISWGQYMHWASIQYEHLQNKKKLSSDAELIGLIAHSIASEYIVIEGWKGLGEQDQVIDKLLEVYKDFVDTFRKCRNAVYHYQEVALDSRLRDAIRGYEQNIWFAAIKWEFERYLYFFPFNKFGFSKETLELSKDFFGCIGWIPIENPVIRINNLLLKFKYYIMDHELNKLDHNDKNDRFILESLKSINNLPQKMLISKLTRDLGI